MNKLRSRLQIDPDALPPPAAATAVPSADAGRQPRAGTRQGSSPTALDDPAIIEGRNGYRSFYVDDVVFARFRAAIYWSSRREDALGEVAPNMSVAVEEFMRTTTEELEQRFNDGAVFRATPDQLKPGKRQRR